MTEAKLNREKARLKIIARTLSRGFEVSWKVTHPGLLGWYTFSEPPNDVSPPMTAANLKPIAEVWFISFSMVEVRLVAISLKSKRPGFPLAVAIPTHHIKPTSIINGVDRFRRSLWDLFIYLLLWFGKKSKECFVPPLGSTGFLKGTHSQGAIGAKAAKPLNYPSGCSPT